MKAVFTCGGTGGHINPALAVARVLLERETVEGAAVDALLEDRWEEYAAAEKNDGAAQAGAAGEEK